jgi:predicted secreted Zn-dependent protease
MTIYPSAQGDLDWRVSRTCDSGACIMVARNGDFVVFGNTSQPYGPTYSYTRAEWKEFLAGAKLGDFDDIS